MASDPIARSPGASIGLAVGIIECQPIMDEPISPPTSTSTPTADAPPVRSVKRGSKAPVETLDSRKATILRTVVEQHVASGQPVGSQHITAAGSLQVSPATVRNDMSALERDGYLMHPHTSSGRVPTDKGYRFFVDSLDQPSALVEPAATRIQDFFASTHGELERLLGETSRLLSGLTDYAAVVVAPTHEAATIRSVQLVGLGSHVRESGTRQVVLAVVVLSSGAIEKHTLELDEATTEPHLVAAATHLATQLVGRQVTDGAAVPFFAVGNPLVDAACAAALQALVPVADPEGADVFVGGAARLTRAFDAVETIRSVLSVLEQQYVVVSLMREALARSVDGFGALGPAAIGTSIGREHAGFEDLQACSVVVAPYLVDGLRVGSVGVLGPTRMNYPQAMAAVAEVSNQLGRRLSDS